MNFLRSVLFEGDEPRGEEKEVAESKEESKPLKEGEEDAPESEDIDDTPVISDSSSGTFPSVWGFGDIVKTIASKSEELFNEYREELQEFSSGLKKETEELVEATGHKVKDLPSTLESGAHVAQESLEEVGQTLEEFGSSFWRGTKEIFTHVRDAVALVEEEAALSGKHKVAAPAYSASIQRGKYSRYEALVSAMQRDSSTYCDEPEDTEEYTSWKNSFKLEDKKPDIDTILKENAFMQELQSRIVPVIVEHETFWTRYFYRLHKLQQAEDARADLVKRAANTEEEELSWDVDEDGDTPSKATTPVTPLKEEVEKDSGDGKDKIETHTEDVKNNANSSVTTTEDIPEEGEKSLEASPTEAKKASPASSGVNHEEEGNSDGSTGSEWQVVTKDEGPLVGSAEKAKSLVKDRTESKSEVVLEDNEKSEVDSGEVKVRREDDKKSNTKKEGKAQEDTPEEDWSEWE